MSISATPFSRHSVRALARPRATVAALAGAAHLIAGIAAILVVCGGLAAVSAYAGGRVAQHALALGPQQVAQKNVGLALQAAQLHRPDLLPIYGSSEFDHGGDSSARYFFRTRPTGFAAALVGDGGDGPLMYLQMLGALGTDLRGQKMAVVLTPDAFLQDELDDDYFAGNFSALQANGLLYNPALSPALRRDVARRLLDYRPTLAQDRLLLFGAEQLAADTPASRALYAAALPLGMLHTAGLRLQDRWATLGVLPASAGSDAPPRAAAAPDWPLLMAQAGAQQRAKTGDTPYGFDPGYWRKHGDEVNDLRGTWSDARFHARLDSSASWADLELLLRVSRELGAQPLILSTPLPGALYADMGVSAPARAEYYARLRALCARYGVPVRSYQEHEADPTFVEDRGSHPTLVSWLYWDRDLDAFFHGRLR